MSLLFSAALGITDMAAPEHWRPRRGLNAVHDALGRIVQGGVGTGGKRGAKDDVAIAGVEQGEGQVTDAVLAADQGPRKCGPRRGRTLSRKRRVR